MNLNEIQIEALQILNEERSIPKNSSKVSITTMNFLLEKELVRLPRYANGEFWELSDKGNDVIKMLNMKKKKEPNFSSNETIVKLHEMKKNQVEKNQNFDFNNIPHCNHCGEDENLAYLEQYANGEYYECKTCGEKFFFVDKEKENAEAKFVEQESEVIKTIMKIKQQPQVQYALETQLKELRVVANKLGLYDAADFLQPYCK